jgi:sialic acid synthase SpsE
MDQPENFRALERALEILQAAAEMTVSAVTFQVTVNDEMLLHSDYTKLLRSW